MNTSIKKEIILSLLLLGIAIMCVFYQMTLMMYIGIHALAITLFVLISLVIWYSKDEDERDEKNKALASDIGFITGGIILGIAMFVQIYQTNKIDVWLMLALSGMIVVRTLSRYWLDRYR